MGCNLGFPVASRLPYNVSLARLFRIRAMIVASPKEPRPTLLSQCKRISEAWVAEGLYGRALISIVFLFPGCPIPAGGGD